MQGKDGIQEHILFTELEKAKYSITEYEKVKQLTLPIDEKHLLLISTETNVPSDKIIENATKLLKQN